MFFYIFAATLISVNSAMAASYDYLGTYKVVKGSCSTDGKPPHPSEGTVAFSLEGSSIGRVLKQVDDANGLKGYMSHYIDGYSSWGAGKFVVEETPVHLLALAKSHVGGKNYADITESFEIAPNGNGAVITVTHSFISNYSYSGTNLCVFETQRH